MTKDRRAINTCRGLLLPGVSENSRQAIYAIGKIGGPEAASSLNETVKRRRCPTAGNGGSGRLIFCQRAMGQMHVQKLKKSCKKERVSDGLLHALAEVPYLEPLEKLMKDPALKTGIEDPGIESHG